MAGEADDTDIIIVANRGPNDFVWENDGWVTRTASGGLVSMLTPLAREPHVAWFCCVSEPPDAQQARQGLYTTAADQTDPRLHVTPVPLPAATYHAYYGLISNEVLWMLQHHVIGVGGFEFLDRARHQAWGRYLEANARLASAIAGTRPLPQAWRETILRGMLGADVVGLQTRMDVRSFLACCEEFLDVPVDRVQGAVRVSAERQVCVRAYPASVDTRALQRLMRSREVADAQARLEPDYAEMNIIRVDRLD